VALKTRSEAEGFQNHKGPCGSFLTITYDTEITAVCLNYCIEKFVELIIRPLLLTLAKEKYLDSKGAVMQKKFSHKWI